MCDSRRSADHRADFVLERVGEIEQLGVSVVDLGIGDERAHAGLVVHFDPAVDHVPHLPGELGLLDAEQQRTRDMQHDPRHLDVHVADFADLPRVQQAARQIADGAMMKRQRLALERPLHDAAMLFVSFAVHAHDAGGEPALSGIPRSADCEEARVERIAIGEDQLVKLGSKDEHDPLSIFFEDSQIAVPRPEAQHAGHGILGKVEQPALGDRKRFIALGRFSGARKNLHETRSLWYSPNQSGLMRRLSAGLRGKSTYSECPGPSTPVLPGLGTKL